MDQFTPNVNDGYLPEAIKEHTINSASLKAKEELDLLTNGKGNKLLESNPGVLLLEGGAERSLVIAENNSEVVLFDTKVEYSSME